MVEGDASLDLGHLQLADLDECSGHVWLWAFVGRGPTLPQPAYSQTDEGGRQRWALADAAAALHIATPPTSGIRSGRSGEGKNPALLAHTSGARRSYLTTEGGG